ncbi:hypothetical protein Tco_0633615 [Tanacetum coccineum]
MTNLKDNNRSRQRQDLKSPGISKCCGTCQNKNGKCSKPQAAYSFKPEDKKKVFNTCHPDIVQNHYSAMIYSLAKSALKLRWMTCFKSTEQGSQIRQCHVDNDPGVSESSELFALACGPSQTPISFNSCVVNGVSVPSDVARVRGYPKTQFGWQENGQAAYPPGDPNLGLKAITDKSGPVSIRFEFGDRETLMPLGEHAAHWANYLGGVVFVEVARLVHYPSWRQVPAEQKAGVMARIGTQFDMHPHMESDRWPLIYAAIQQHLQKIYNGKEGSQRKGIGILTQTRLMTWSALDYHVLRTFPRSIGMRRLRSGMIPRTVPGRPKINKTWQKARFRADKWRAPALLESTRTLIHHFFLTHTVNVGILRTLRTKLLYGLGSNTEMGVPYTEDEIMAIVRGGKQRGHIPGVGRVLPGQGTVIPPPSPCTYSSDVVKLKKKEKVLTRQVNMFMKLFRSDDKFSQMLNQLESQPEIGGGSESGGY